MIGLPNESGGVQNAVPVPGLLHVLPERRLPLHTNRLPDGTGPHAVPVGAEDSFVQSGGGWTRPVAWQRGRVSNLLPFRGLGYQCEAEWILEGEEHPFLYDSRDANPERWLFIVCIRPAA